MSVLCAIHRNNDTIPDQGTLRHRQVIVVMLIFIFEVVRECLSTGEVISDIYQRRRGHTDRLLDNSSGQIELAL